MRLLLSPYYRRCRLLFALHSSPANYGSLIGLLWFPGQLLCPDLCSSPPCSRVNRCIPSGPKSLTENHSQGQSRFLSFFSVEYRELSTVSFLSNFTFNHNQMWILPKEFSGRALFAYLPSQSRLLLVASKYLLMLLYAC